METIIQFVAAHYLDLIPAYAIIAFALTTAYVWRLQK